MYVTEINEDNLHLIHEETNVVRIYWSLQLRKRLPSFLSPDFNCLLKRLKAVIDFSSLISFLYYEGISPVHLGPMLSSFFLIWQILICP